MQKKSNTNFVGKALTLLLSVMLCISLVTHAQVGTPSYFNTTATGSGNAFPLNSTTSNKVQWIYPPNAFSTLGDGNGVIVSSGNNITKIWIKLSTTTSPTASYSDLTLSLGQNVGTLASYPTSGAGYAYYTGLTQCFYQASGFTMPGVVSGSWFGITLSTPFLYDPTQSLIVELKCSAGTGNTVANVTTTGLNQRIYAGYSATTGTSNTGLTPIGMEVTPAVACTAPPTPGTATATPSSGLCLGNPVILNLTGNSAGSGQTYQWQSGPTATGPWTNEGSSQTSAYYNLTASTTLYYQCEVTCSGNTATSTPVLVSVNPALAGGTYTINSALPTGGSNFQSFTDFATALNCGISGPIVANVASGSGPYVQQITLGQIGGSSSTNTITINGNGNTLSATGTSGLPYTLGLNGTDYLTINDLEIDGLDPTYGMACHLWNGADNNTFNNCIFKCDLNTSTSTTSPFSCSGSATSVTSTGISGINNLVNACTAIGGYYSISFYGNSSGLSSGNKVQNSTAQDFYLYGIYGVYQDGWQAVGNIVERPNRTTLSTCYGIYSSTSSIKSEIRKNRVRSLFAQSPINTSTTYCIYVSVDGTLGNEQLIYNNMIYDIKSAGAIYGIYTPNVDYVKIFHNTISIDDPSASTTSATYAIYNSGTVANIDIRNNLVYIKRGGTGTKYGQYITSNIAQTNYNDVFNASTTGTSYYGYYNAIAYSDLATWQTGTSQGANSVSMDPQFLSSTILYPTNASLNDLGTPTVGITTDIDGNPRSLTTPDMGAVEFSILACTNPPTPGTVSSTLTNVCNGVTFTLSLSGGSFGVGQTYQWESSPDNITWTPISGATSPSYIASQAYTTYYRCAVTCGVTVNSASIQIISTAPPLAGNYTINSALPTGGTNYASFASLVADLNCGGISAPVVVDVVSGSGPYNEQVSFGQIGGVSSTNTITINGNGETLKYTSSSSTLPSTLELNGSDYMIFNDLTVEALGGTYAFACHLWNNADNNAFNNCNFITPIANTSSTTSAFTCSGSATSASTSGASGINNVLTNCKTVGGYYGLVFAGNSAVATTGNKTIDCIVEDFYLYGLYFLYQNGMHVKGCDISQPNRTTHSTDYALYASTGTVGCLIEKNTVHDLYKLAPTNTSTAYCIYAGSDGTLGNENKIYNNLVYNIMNSGINYGMYLSGTDYVQAYHNTISLDNTAATAGTTYGIYSSGTVGGIDIKNNIVTISRGGTGTKYGLYYTGTFQSSNYNDVYINAAAGTNYFGYWISTPYANLATFQTASSQEANSLSVDPVYVDPSLGNFAPATVAVDNLGTPLAAVTDDINGAPRSATTPDMGAYEFSVPTDDVAVTAMINPTLGTGCKTNNEVVEIELKNYGLNPVDFSLAPANITVNVGGPNPTTLFETLTSGTIPIGGTLNVVLTSTVDMSAVGTYTFDISCLYLLDANSSNDILPTQTVILPSLVAGTISTLDTNICVSGSPTINLSGNMGGNIQWQESSVSDSGPWTNVGTGATSYTTSTPYTSDMWVRAEVSCNGNIAYTNIIKFLHVNPIVASTTPGTRCGVGTVDLSATPSSGATIAWFDSPTSLTPLATGNNFTTPSINATTSYYAAAVTGSGLQTVPGDGAWNHFTTAGSFQTTTITGAYMILNVLQPTQLSQVDIYPSAALGTAFTVEARTGSASGTTYATYSTTTSVVNSGTPTVAQTLPLNWVLTPGTYYIGFINNPSTWRSGLATHTYPWVLPGVVTIDYALTPSYQYYFYNSKFNTGCAGSRVPVVATVNTPPSVTVSATSTTLCSGQSTNLSVTSSNDPNYTYTWMPGSLSGANQTVTPTSTTTYTLSAIDNTTGTYATCANEGTTTVTVNPVPVFTTSATPASIPCGGSSTISAVQNPIFVSGTGTVAQSATGYSPYSHLYEGQRTQYLVLASELVAQNIGGGNITALSFNVTSKLSGPAAGNPAGDFKSYTIKMANTSATTLASADATGSFTTVWGPTNYTTTAGVNTHTFTTPFVWDGVSNVVVQVCFENDPTGTLGVAYTSNDVVASTATTGFTGVRGYYLDNSTLCSGVGGTLQTSTSNTRPNITFVASDNNAYVWEPGSLSGSTHTVTPASTTTYTATATNSFACTTTHTQSITVAPCTATLNITAFIQGFYAGTSTMQAALVNQGVSTNPTDCDTVTVELHNATSPYATAHSFTGVLQTNGTLACTFPPAAVGNSYYIVMNHRNSVQTWSAAPVAISTVGSYMFSTSATQSYGSNEVDAFTDGVYSMYNGDVNQDGFIDIFDFLDWDVDNQNFASGYYATDLNGDSFVDIFDFLVWDPNNQSFIGLITP
ncbi:MAG: hypothetical protein R2831_05360 [Chitinophagaceae bacterium]